ncbi:hypothetical protein ASG52_25705 [Methylobacterium sp. Leaf456]|nr:hypothetical protein ASG52_25705 [Methylobacterium sp. Leaf456]
MTMRREAAWTVRCAPATTDSDKAVADGIARLALLTLLGQADDDVLDVLECRHGRVPRFALDEP